MSAPTNTVKHTPGPWTDNKDIRVRGHGSIGLGLCFVNCEPDSPSDIEARANAHLIAAAPDLLEALHVVGMSAGWQYLTFETRALIEAAISKATGSPAPQEKGR